MKRNHLFHFYTMMVLCLFGLSSQTGWTQCPAYLGTGVTTVTAVPYTDIGHDTTGDVDDITSATAANECNGNYLGGEDHVYIFTPAASNNFDIALTNQTSIWGGFQVFDACPDLSLIHI